MNPCPENNKDADKSVPSAYSLFCGKTVPKQCEYDIAVDF